MVERVTDNLAALSFHGGGGGGDAQDRDHDPCTKEGEGDDGEDGDVTRRDHAVVAARVEAAAAAADPALGAAYASHVAEGMRAAVYSAGAGVVRLRVQHATQWQGRNTFLSTLKPDFPNNTPQRHGATSHLGTVLDGRSALVRAHHVPLASRG